MKYKWIKALINTTCFCILIVNSLSAQYTDSLSLKEYHQTDQSGSYPAMMLELKRIISSDYTDRCILKAKYPVRKEGIFCKWEDRIIEKSRIPIKFRLGSLEYADRIEGKNTGIISHPTNLP